MDWGIALRGWLPAGGFGQALYVYDSVDSTNAVAAQLAEDGAAQGTLVVADHQRRGRGRAGSRWVTLPGSSIAMSLVLRPSVGHPLRWTGLGALAVADALERQGLVARIKWPNDVLLGGRKAAGVLAEAAWEGDGVRHLVLGIGVNVGRGALPAGALDFPATTVEEHAGAPVDRSALIAQIVASVERWYPRLESDEFLRGWQDRLAFLADRVRIEVGTREVEGRFLGLGPEGEARLRMDDGREAICAGEARSLRPVPAGA